MRANLLGLALALLAISIAGARASQLILDGPQCSATQSVWAMVCNEKALLANGITFKPFAYLNGAVDHAYSTGPVYNAGPYAELLRHECSAGNISLSIPVGAPGYYKLEIYEVEYFHRTRTPSGCPRVFSICAEDHMIAAGTCLFDYPGVDHATTFTQQFYVDDGAVNVNLFASTGTAKLAGLVVTRLNCKKATTSLGAVSGTCRAGSASPPAVPPTQKIPSPAKRRSPKAPVKRSPPAKRPATTNKSPKRVAPPKSTRPPPKKSTPAPTTPSALPFRTRSVTTPFPPAGTVGTTPSSHTLTLLPATATLTPTPSAGRRHRHALLQTTNTTASPTPTASPSEAAGPPDNITWPGPTPPAGPATLTLTYPLPLSVASLTILGTFAPKPTANLTIELLDPSGTPTRIYSAPAPPGTSLTAKPPRTVPLVSAVRITAANPAQLQIDTVQLSGTLDPDATAASSCNAPSGTLLQWAASASDPTLPTPPTPTGSETNAVGRPDGAFWSPAARPANLHLDLTYPTTVAPTYVLLYGTFPPNATLTLEALPSATSTAGGSPPLTSPVTLFAGAAPPPTPGAPPLRWLPVPLPTNPTYTTTTLRLTADPSQVSLDAALLIGYPSAAPCTPTPAPAAPTLLSSPTTPAPLTTAYAVRALGASGPYPPTNPTTASTVNPTLVTGAPDARAAALPSTPTPAPYLALYYATPTAPTSFAVRGRALPTTAPAPTLTAALVDSTNTLHLLPPADLPPPSANYSWLNFTIPANSTLAQLNVSRVLLLPTPPDAWETDAAALTGADASLVLPPWKGDGTRSVVAAKDRSFRDKLSINGDKDAGLALFIAGLVLAALLLCAAIAYFAWRTGRAPRSSSSPSDPPSSAKLPPPSPAQQQHNFSCFPRSANPKATAAASRAAPRGGPHNPPTPPAAAAAALAALPAPRRKYWLFGPYVWPTSTAATSTTGSISKSPRSWHQRHRRGTPSATTPPRGTRSGPHPSDIEASPAKDTTTAKGPASKSALPPHAKPLPRPPAVATTTAPAPPTSNGPAAVAPPPTGLMLPPRGASRSVELTMSEANVVATSTPGSQMVDARAAAAWSSWSRDNPAAAMATTETDIGRSRTSDVTVTMSEQQYIAYQAFLDACRRVT